MAKSWADECADKWGAACWAEAPDFVATWFGATIRSCIDSAVREALDKAAEMAQRTPCQTLVEAGLKGFIEHAIRALK